jgi:hypothetical protein
MGKVVDMYFNDDSIIEGIKSFDTEACTSLYNKHKDYCIRFMKSKFEDEEEIKDIFQDAIIVFIENVRNKNLKLEKTSIQTYLNSVCFNQLKIRFNIKNKPFLSGDDEEIYNNYKADITDWLSEMDSEKNERLTLLQYELDALKISGPKCYEILMNFYFKKKTMEEIAKIMDYTNADNAKTQNYKCKERLKKSVLARLKK